MFESLQWTVSKPQRLTSELGWHVVSQGAGVRILLKTKRLSCRRIR